MAQKEVLLDQDQFCCSICLDLLKEPVTIPCGHSYCRSCIQSCWDQVDLKGLFSCPQCRQTFTEWPTLGKNNMLSEVVEKLKIGLQPSQSILCYAGPGDVACDFCTGTRKQKALMFCLVCLVSSCETHLQPHYNVPGLKKHTLIKASSQLQEKLCPQHDELLNIYCRTDQHCICFLCSMGEHVSHNIVTAAAERKEKQSQLGMSQQKVKQRIQERETDLKELQHALESLKHSAQTAVKNSEKGFTELIRSIERRSSEVKELIRAQEKAQVSQAEGIMDQLKQEIAELRKRSTKLEQLSHTKDHIHFLQSFPSVSSSREVIFSDIPRIVVNPLQYFGEVNKAVSELRDKLEDILKGERIKISTPVKSEVPLEPMTREQFLQYSCQLSLDPNTAHKCLSLSEGNRRVKPTKYIEDQNPDHFERFTHWCQVLCREGLSGRCYWEVEWNNKIGLTAVSYKDISRIGKGNDSRFGHNDRSWCLKCNNNEYYSFRHNDITTVVSGPKSSRVGVFLDHKAGTLSFYSVSNTMTLLHKVQTTFTQPLYPGLSVWYIEDSAELSQL